MQQKGPLEGAPLAHVRASRKQGRLSVVNRLLLAVMLCRADRFGVVRDLGRAELSRLTGLSQERLKNRIRTLLDSGLIRAYTPGATGSVIFKKTKSVYYLNLHHPELNCGQRLPILLVSVDRVPTEDNDVDVVDGIFKSGRELRSQLTGEVRKFFKDSHEQGLAPFMRGRLDLYAGYLLSHHWSVLGEGEGEAELAQLIKLDLLGAPDAEDSQRLATYLCDQAGNVARGVRGGWFQGKSALIDGMDFEELDYVLLPMREVAYKSRNDRFYPSRAVLALPPDDVVCAGKLHVVEFGLGNQVKVQVFSSLETVSNAEQYLYGLLTPPEGELSV